jgi:amidase
MRNDWYARQGLDHLAPNAIQKLSARNAAAMIASGQLRAETLVRACLDRVSLRDSTVHAWSFLNPDSVLAEARARDSVAPVGPLHGIPIAVKDVIDVAGLPTGMGSPIYAGYHPFGDAACVAALRAAGAVIMGKTVTAEFAGVAPGATTHPMAPEHTPGGSSSGSATFRGGLPVGVQFVGRPYGDAALLTLSKWVVSDAEML